MHILVYMRSPRDGIYTHTPIPLTCRYSGLDNLSARSFDKEDMEDGVLDLQMTYWVCGPIRCPLMDSGNEIYNRYAYVHAYLYPVVPETRTQAWVHMQNSMGTLDALRSMNQIDPDVLDMVELLLWRNSRLSGLARMMCRSMYAKMLQMMAERVYHPDHVWSTGWRKGMTTAQSIQKKHGTLPMASHAPAMEG